MIVSLLLNGKIKHNHHHHHHHHLYLLKQNMSIKLAAQQHGEQDIPVLWALLPDFK